MAFAINAALAEEEFVMVTSRMSVRTLSAAGRRAKSKA